MHIHMEERDTEEPTIEWSLLFPCAQGGQCWWPSTGQGDRQHLHFGPAA